ncbi:MAG: SDR family NAD(P)-dependent oxidoreductase [Hyphomicrobiaceae bacterium]|nr:SDR family NAD(P)-dependent oxidoreductase [Hyphomicrobiaceae bacterium]
METAVIVGGSAGIGLAIAHRLAALGHGLLLVARDERRLAAAAADLEARHGVEVTTVALDAVAPEAPAVLARHIATRPAAPRCLVIGLGTWSEGPAIELSDAEMRRVTDANVMAPLALLRALVPLMPAGSGVLVIGSLAALMPLPGLSEYAASKAHLHASVLAMREEVASSGIRVCVLAPGLVPTGFVPGAATTPMRSLLDALASRPETVARAAVTGLGANVPLIVPGLLWRLVAFGIRILPGGILGHMSRLVAPALGAQLAGGHSEASAPREAAEDRRPV